MRKRCSGKRRVMTINKPSEGKGSEAMDGEHAFMCPREEGAWSIKGSVQTGIAKGESIRWGSIRIACVKS